MTSCYCKDPSVCPCRPACQLPRTFPNQQTGPTQRREPPPITEEDVRRIVREEIFRSRR